MGLKDRLQHAWNAFTNNRDPTVTFNDVRGSYSRRPDRVVLSRGNERTIVNSICNRIALDASAMEIQHVQLDENGRFLEMLPTGLNSCLTMEANIDQTARAFRHDAILSMLDEGVVALVPVDTTKNPALTESYDIGSMRTGKILEWFPRHVKVQIYNDRTGQKEEITLPKSMVAIVENPFRSVMNEPNSTMQRLIRKLNLLDTLDEKNSSGKLDMIIQLPYLVKTELSKQRADKRRRDLEEQLQGPYGIAYIDGTEKVTQLNRPIENNLMGQIEYLTSMLYSQLGITQAILDGTANEETMLNYYDRIIEPIVAAIVDEMKRKFLSKTARTQMKSIMYFRNPFKLVPIKDLSEMADKMTRNEIMTSNEIRQVIGMKPADDPKADQLINSNLNHPEEGADKSTPEAGPEDSGGNFGDTPISQLMAGEE